MLPTIQYVYPEVIKNVRSNPLLLILILMNTVKYVLKKAEDLNLSVFNMITGINESKT